jgi:hypothetical protein
MKLMKVKIGGNPLELQIAPDAPPAPKKKYPHVSRLTKEQNAIMDNYEYQLALKKKEFDDYGSAQPLDLSTMPEVPIGDDYSPEYGKIHLGQAGVLGGMVRKSKRKSRKNKRTNKRKTAHKSRKNKRTNKRKTSRKSRKNKRK